MTVTVEQRDARAKAIDAFLVLCAADRMVRLGGEPGRTLFHKVFFAVKARLGRRVAPHYGFVRWDFGPFSFDLRDDLETLEDRGTLRRGAGGPTPRGAQIVEVFRPLLEPANRALFTTLDEEASKRARWTAARAKREAYGVLVSTTEGLVKLETLPKGTGLVFPDIMRPDVVAEDDALRELVLALALTPERLRRARTFTPESTAAARRLMDL